ncbi:MAG: F0F1 ATP synthase subunit A [Eubacteriales bacterium]|nr:F0F1 ATP synthase subunit A [Eubacteriales bacterium]
MNISIDTEVLAHLPDGIALFGGMPITNTLVTALVASAALMVLALLARIFALPRFREQPAGVQNVLELMVEGMQRYTIGRLGDGLGNQLAPYMFTIAAFIGMNGFLELIGIGVARPAPSDLNCTFGLALVTFVLIQVYGIKKKGIKGRLKSYATPSPVIFPIKLVTDLAVPVSLACRMFGNILGGMIVMELLYSVAALSFVLPAFLSAYFTVFHTGMQVFIFITLSLAFIEEAVE